MLPHDQLLSVLKFVLSFKEHCATFKSNEIRLHIQWRTLGPEYSLECISKVVKKFAKKDGLC
jgi:hypothetical protein